MSKEILDNIISEFSPDRFERFFRAKNDKMRYPDEPLGYDDAENNWTEGKILAEGKLDDGELIVCSFLVKKELTERSGKKAQYNLGKKILKEQQADAGIFIFYTPQGNFRFSLIYTNYLGTRRDWSNFKRFTYFVSREITNKTFLKQIGEGNLSTLANIKEAFSVDPVRKQFYSEIQTWYFWAMDKIKFPDDYKHSTDPDRDKEIRNATNLIRLITRIIFIWFLMEKGLILPDLFSREKLAGILKDFMNSNKASNFYNAILQNLFFGTLNQKMDERKFVQEGGVEVNKKEYGVKNLYRYGGKFLISKDEVLKLLKDIPFLNGGLFDCLDKEDETGKVIYVDGFSRNPAKHSIIPDYLFFQQEEERVDLS
ncbi:MAG: class I SAM-dependent DNA methyltransferase, partial [bacterium]